ncbi:MAG: metallophosphoesterase [Anaerolineales bacterium]|nr:metallophosphoesterase [Anaerolineales bacterium]
MNIRKGFILIAVIFLVVVGAIGYLWGMNSKETSEIVFSPRLSALPMVGEKVRFVYRVMSDASDFTIIALPDTQHYSEKYPEIYASQTAWIVENAVDRNIVFVTHLGDIVQNNDLLVEEWKAADSAMSVLDGVVPYAVLPGNHDMQEGGQAGYYEQYFPVSRYQDQPWWGGNFNGNKNNYQLFSAGGDDYLFLHLQYCPTNEAIEWANEVVKEHDDRIAMVSTHAYLHLNDRFRQCKDHSDGTVDGGGIWRRLVKNNTNIYFVLSGHVPGVARQTDNQGRPVHQMLSDYQDMENGGNGYLRILTFHPNTDLVTVTTYSPYLDAYLTDDDNQFQLSFDMTGGEALSGEVTITNGVDSCTGTVQRGSCELIVTTAGMQTFAAEYSGDPNHTKAVSEKIIITVENE